MLTFNHLLLFLFILIINNSISLTTSQLKGPNLSKNYRFLNDLSNSNGVYPCNGSFLKTNGTTCGLKEIMLGRCYEHQYIKRGLYLSNKTETKNCSELYELFETAVRYKAHCDMNMTTYEKYFARALDDVHIIDRAIFWSGTYAIAHAYGGHGTNYITLEDTLASAMVDGLKWCGKENDTEGFDYVSCPNNCKDNQWADYSFWGLASTTFAQRVTGEIFVVLNGSRAGGSPSFRNDSYFARFELPNFQKQGPYRVTKINTLVLHTPDHDVVERCGEKSLKILENLVREYKIEYSCTDDPEALILVMCGDEWEARECQIARQVLRKEWDKKVFGKSTANYYSISIFFLLINSIFFSVRFII